VAPASTACSPAHEEAADRQPRLAVPGEQVLVPVRDDAEQYDQVTNVIDGRPFGSGTECGASA
jgi:hypothetical protein